MVRLWPNLLDAVQVVRPDTVLRWHRVGFRVADVIDPSTA
jgi:hypothetical protein